MVINRNVVLTSFHGWFKINCECFNKRNTTEIGFQGVFQCGQFNFRQTDHRKAAFCQPKSYILPNNL